MTSPSGPNQLPLVPAFPVFIRRRPMAYRQGQRQGVAWHGRPSSAQKHEFDVERCPDVVGSASDIAPFIQGLRGLKRWLACKDLVVAGLVASPSDLPPRLRSEYVSGCLFWGERNELRKEYTVLRSIEGAALQLGCDGKE